MSEDVEFAHRRILLIDDNPANCLVRFLDESTT